MDKANKVKVKLKGSCYVGKKICQKGEIVEVNAEVAKDFGDIISNKSAEQAEKATGSEPAKAEKA